MQQTRTFREGLNLRLPDGLRDAIKVSAAKNRRSMNAEVVMILENAYGLATVTDQPSTLAAAQEA